ncbi:MAG: aldo/keto reductase [Bacteroidales bacterium]|jgi:predicted oxidoreductase|nr:aldo/keto reductase [Bacteroidales bacterium]
MKKVPEIKLSDSLEISRFAHGFWRLNEWKMDTSEILRLVETLLEWGITTFDHADIYGDYTCEKLFGDALSMKPGLRHKVNIITKCGIKLLSDHFPERGIKSYDYSFRHIISSVESSLKKLQIDRIELLLFHRPAPFFDAAEAARAMDELHTAGKVLHFGVSNYNPMQFEMLQKHTPFKLMTNQVEISPYCLEHFDNGNIDFFIKESIHPMAWSPLAGGRIFKHADDRSVRLLNEIRLVAGELGAETTEEVIYAWLLLHPAGIIPVIGTGKTERVRHAVRSLELNMDMEQWYRIYNASRGTDLP